MGELKIHPTAIVDLAAKLGAGTDIGPFSIVGPHAVIREKTIVQSHVVVEGKVVIGSGNFIGHGAIIGAPPQDVSFTLERKTRVEIGNDNIIREYCTVHRGRSAHALRGDVVLGQAPCGVHGADADARHSCRDPRHAHR